MTEPDREPQPNLTGACSAGPESGGAGWGSGAGPDVRESQPLPGPRVLLVPPDTRPPTLDLPVGLGRMTGARVRVPPPEALPDFFTPGDTGTLAAWLRSGAGDADVLVVCLETLCLGGMIPARRVSDPLAGALERLALLRELKATNPALRISAFGVIVRVAHDNDPHEEKAYYGEWGRELRAYSTAFDRHARHGEAERAGLDAARAAVPSDILADWVGTRERNRTLHLAALDLLAEGVLSHLCLTLDDTTPYGLAAFDRRLLEARADELGVWDRLDVYPGADEVPCALLARALRPEEVPVWVRFSGLGGAGAELLYEDRPAGELVRAHLRAAGCRLADSPQEAAFVLAVNTPGTRQAHRQPDFAAVDTPHRHLPAFVDALRADLRAGRVVSVADIAYPNGAERRLWTLMQTLPLADLAGFSAWNTAGNTLGSAVAFGKLAPLVTDRAAQAGALLSRIADDVLYQAEVRTLIRERLGSPSPFDLGAQRAEAESALQELMPPRVQTVWDAHFVGRGLRLELGTPHLAWPRLFTGVVPLTVTDAEPSSGS
ncbi:DUF4127 family protein [Deinococcus radiotolerans]|uniref:DUF4127 family protein n=1 Tax=Deinococcus radiotolerans TaxID=1309407 RepID=A0ABQ2FE77_9DEIO|nr:DUF4127 family protein [Deinococcus radiotolerans]GGK89687.1 hypothetical protein GCM10010844_05290 [Deinococcus radiotolerans]